MQTNLADFIRGTREGDEAEAILRACVHCGFCTATCPTYVLLGDELDGPRGRIYLIKSVLEGEAPTRKTQLHLDRCLTCRACETTCPSGVRYSRLLDIGRKAVDARVPRPAGQRTVRATLAAMLPRAGLFKAAFRAGRLARPLLPPALRDKLQPPAPAGTWPSRTHARRMLVLEGCVQPAMAPNVNAAAARVLDAFGVQLVTAPRAGCCGALRYHTTNQEDGLADMRRNVDAWWPRVENGDVEAIVMTASGCGVMVKDYGHLLAHDPAYALRAARIAATTRDLSEVLAEFTEAIAARTVARSGERVAYHPPCTLQHGQRVRGKAEAVLRAAGIDVTLCADSHLCCGSAGTYSVLQPALAGTLRDRKLAALAATGATHIVSANVGCIAHLQSGTSTPVTHWVELLDRVLAGTSTSMPAPGSHRG
jgi:glycolate oxidase iron-sulfur subunit